MDADKTESEMTLPERRLHWLRQWSQEMRTDIPALCDSHDEQAKRIEELEVERDKAQDEAWENWNSFKRVDAEIAILKAKL